MDRPCVGPVGWADLQVRLRHIAHVGEVHEVLAAANDDTHLTLLRLGHDGGHKEGIPLPEDAARAQRYCGKPALAIGSQNKLLAQNLQPGLPVSMLA